MLSIILTERIKTRQNRQANCTKLEIITEIRL